MKLSVLTWIKMRRKFCKASVSRKSMMPRLARAFKKFEFMIFTSTTTASMDKRAKIWSEYSSLCWNCFLKQHLRTSRSRPLPSTHASLLEIYRRTSAIGKRTFQSSRVCGPKSINSPELTINSLTKSLSKLLRRFKMIGILHLSHLRPRIAYQFENVWQNGRNKTLNRTKRPCPRSKNFRTP